MPRLLLAALSLSLLAACSGKSDTGGDTDLAGAGTDADGDGYIAGEDDCDDTNAAIHPGAVEVCDDVDNNCDGSIDEGVANTYYTDADGDGFGDPSSPLLACARPDGAATVDTDCDDADATVYPAATEVCDGVDNDCDGLIDDADDDVDTSGGTVFYADVDGDLYGDPSSSVVRCTAGDGYVDNSDDCDDSSIDIRPGAPEICNGLDDDCDGLVDGADPDVTGTSLAYVDADGDGYGDPTESANVCALDVGYSADNTDCDDSDATVNPGATESCKDEVDNDCDGEVNEDCTDCGALNILEYYDSYTAGDTPVEGAAALRGDAITATSDATTFATDYDGGSWDVLVVEVPGGFVPAEVTDRLKTAISGGVVVLYSDWYLGSESSTASILGVSVASIYYSPYTLSAATGSTLWTASETLPDKITPGSTDSWGINGEILSAVDASTSSTLALLNGDSTEPAVLATYSGQVLVNAFLPDDFYGLDLDADGIVDMVELYDNELALATGCAL